MKSTQCSQLTPLSATASLSQELPGSLRMPEGRGELLLSLELGEPSDIQS